MAIYDHIFAWQKEGHYEIEYVTRHRTFSPSCYIPENIKYETQGDAIAAAAVKINEEDNNYVGFAVWFHQKHYGRDRIVYSMSKGHTDEHKED